MLDGSSRWPVCHLQFNAVTIQSRRLENNAEPHGSEQMKHVTMVLAAAVVGFWANCSMADERRPLDNDFLIKAASCENAEIQFGKLAASKANSEKVKELGALMVKDHEKAYDKLAHVIKDRKIGVVAGLEKDVRAEAEKLGKLQGANFDREFLDWAIKTHKEGIAIFEAQTKDGKDAAVRDFAKECLPAMREHLRIAEELSKTIGQ
jgi:putative membrane protein